MRTRLRVCLGSLDPNACARVGGRSWEQQRCNTERCPWWGSWGGFGECSENCGGGIKSRTRSCVNSLDEIQPAADCAGPSTDEELCNETSCEREIIYWNNQLSNGQWTFVGGGELPEGDSMLDRCSSFCLSTEGCLGMAVSTFRLNGNESEECYINDRPYTSGPNCWGSLCDSTLDHQTIVFGVFKDYYEENPEFLPTDDPDGEMDVNVNDVTFNGICNGIQVGNDQGGAFGLTVFRETDGVAFDSDDKNVLREDGTADCGPRCFLKAGCKAFYTNDNEDTCTMIFNSPDGGTEVAGVGNGGVLTDLCYNIAFDDQVSRASRFNCIFFSPDQSDEVLQEVLDRNGVGTGALNTWTHKVLNGIQGNPYVVQSQYVHVTFPDNDGTDERYRAVYFNIETHIRVGRYNWAIDSQSMAGRKRRESVRVGELTEAADMKNHKQTAKAAKKQRNEASQEYPLEAVLAAAIAGEKDVTDFILGGGLDMPASLSVAATGPIELVEFVRRTDDGSIAADCSSGTDCTCSSGFIDNGEGCVEMTEEQAATTEAPTTQTTSYSNVVEYLPSLVDKMSDVFEDNRPGAGRTHLLTKWNNFSQKFLNRYSNLVERGCTFSSGLENTVDFDTVNTCRVSFLVTLSNDCTEQKLNIISGYQPGHSSLC